IEISLRANNRTDGYVRVIVTRGAGTLGLDPRKCEPVVIVIAEEVGLYPRELYAAGLEVISIEHPRPFPPGGLLGRAGAVLAHGAALRNGCFEALRFEPDGTLIGACEAAVFVVADGVVKTAGDPGCPDAVVRTAVLEIARAGGHTAVEAR